MAGRSRAAAQDVVQGEVIEEATQATVVDFPEQGEQPAEAQPEAKPKSEAVLKREAYTAAEATLREKYNEEFKGLVRAEAAKRGVEYVFRKTEEEKAQEQLAALYERFPHLRPQG